MRPTDKDFRQLRKVDDQETHERIWRPRADPELPLAGRLEIVALPENGASSEVILDGRKPQAANHAGRGCFAKPSEWVCDARTREDTLLARSVMLGDNSRTWRRLVPLVGDTFDIFLPADTSPEEATKLMECVTFGRFQRMAADSTD